MDQKGRTQRREAAEEAARLAGALLLEGMSEDLGTTAKGRNDFVTVMDVRSEEIIRTYLHQRFPEDNFLGEEMGFDRHGDGGTWVIDPIDGTANYIHGLPGYTVSIAYEEEKWHPVVGVVYNPPSGSLYSAQEGQGAWLDGKRIHVSSVSDPHRSALMISPPLRNPSRLADFLPLYEKLCRESGELRDYGSAALHYAYIAQGLAEAYIEFGISYHDIAAGMVLVSEAGGNISHLDLRDTGEWPRNFIVSNRALHQWFCDAVQLRCGVEV